MNSVRLSVVTAVAVIAAGPWAIPGRAAPARVAPSTPRAHAKMMTMDQAVRMVERRFQARVVRAETRTQGGRTVYVLRLLDRSGRVFTVRVDAASGRIL